MITDEAIRNISGLLNRLEAGQAEVRRRSGSARARESLSPVSDSSPRAQPADDVFGSVETLHSCMAFHDAIPLAEYNFDELVSYGLNDLNKVMMHFFELVQDGGPAVLEATFAVSHGYLIDLAKNECHLSPRATGSLNQIQNQSLEIAREYLLQAVATRRPSVKLRKMADCIRAISEVEPNGSPMSADDLLEALSAIVPTIPMLTPTVVLMRVFLNHFPDKSISIGPLGYALTTIEAVLGSSSIVS